MILGLRFGTMRWAITNRALVAMNGWQIMHQKRCNRINLCPNKFSGMHYLMHAVKIMTLRHARCFAFTLVQLVCKCSHDLLTAAIAVSTNLPYA